MLDISRVLATIACSDLARSRRFYEGTLGLTEVEEQVGGVVYRCGEGTGLLLYESQFAGSGGATVCSFECSDVDQCVTELRDSGVTFEEYDLPGIRTIDGIAEMDGMRGAWFKDPDGNILAVTQPAHKLALV